MTRRTSPVSIPVLMRFRLSTLLRQPTKSIITALVLSLFLFSSLKAQADLPLARLNTVFPMGAHPGTTVDVTLEGADLEGTTQLYFSKPGVSATHVEGLKFRIAVAADVPTGPIDVRAIGTWGISNPRTFVISPLTEALETEPNNLIEQAQKVAADTVVNGTIGSRADVDYYAVTLEAGQPVVIDCFGERIDSQLDGVLTLFSPDGRAIALSNGYEGKDPRIDFVAPVAGEYRVRVHDLVYNGGPQYFYRLALHRQPVIDYAFPPVVAAGQQAELKLVGRNLPGSQPMEKAEIQGRPMEQLALAVAAPGMDDSAVLVAETFLQPRQAVEDGFAVRFGNSLPVVVGVSHHPVALEAEPNDSDAKAQVITWPSEVVGRCDRVGDHDIYRFTAKKDQVIDIQVLSEQAGFPADLSLLLRRITATNAENGQLTTQDVAESDDNGASVGGLSYITSTHDPSLRFTVPVDGDYLLDISDRFAESRGDARFVYRIQIAAPEPDFRLLVTPADLSNSSSLLVHAGGTTEAVVYALRRGGFAGEIRVSVEGLPPTVKAEPIVIGPGATEAPLVLYGAPDAPEFTGPIEIVGTSKLGDKAIVRKARSATITWPAGGNAPRRARLTRGTVLAVRGTAPYLLKTKPASLKIGQGSQLVVNAELERRWADFTDKLTALTGQHLPPNVDNGTTEIAAGQTAGQVALYFKPEIAPGTYTFNLKGTGKVPFTRTPSDPNAKKEPIDVAEPSLPVEITVVPRPADIAPSSGEPAVKPGQFVNLAVKVNRQNGYTGPIRLSLTLPPGVVGIQSPEISLPSDVSDTILPIQVAADVPVGDKGGVTIRGTAKIGEDIIPVDARVVLKVVN